MKKLLSLLALVSVAALGADILIQPGTTSNPAAGGKMYLQTADDHVVPAQVVYTTDGNGHLIPIPASGGGGGTPISGTPNTPAAFDNTGTNLYSPPDWTISHDGGLKINGSREADTLEPFSTRNEQTLGILTSVSTNINTALNRQAIFIFDGQPFSGNATLQNQYMEFRGNQPIGDLIANDTFMSIGANEGTTGSVRNLIYLQHGFDILNGSQVEGYNFERIGGVLHEDSTLQNFTGINFGPTFNGTVSHGIIPYQSFMTMNGSYAYVEVLEARTNFGTGSHGGNVSVINLYDDFLTGSTLGSHTASHMTPTFRTGSHVDNVIVEDIQPTFEPGNFTNNATGLNITPHGDWSQANSGRGLSINMSDVTPPIQNNGQNVTIEANGGSFIAQYEIQLKPSLNIQQGHIVGGTSTIALGTPVSNTFFFGNNQASNLVAHDDMGPDGTGIGLNWVNTASVGQLAVDAGKTVEGWNGVLVGSGVFAGSGTINEANMFTAAGFIPQGGTVSVLAMSGYRVFPTLCLASSTDNCIGFKNSNVLAHNYFARDLVIGPGSEIPVSTTASLEVRGEIDTEVLTLNGATVNRVLVTDSASHAVPSSITTTELEQLAGVTGNIQAQLNAIPAPAGVGCDFENIDDTASPHTIVFGMKGCIYSYEDSTGGPISTELPTAVGNGGKCVDIDNTGNAPNTITITAPLGQTISTLASDTISNQEGSTHYCSDDSNWHIH